MYRYTTRGVHCYLRLQEKIHCKKYTVNAASLALNAQNFVNVLEKYVVPYFTNRLTWALHKICKYKGFL